MPGQRGRDVSRCTLLSLLDEQGLEAAVASCADTAGVAERTGGAGGDGFVLEQPEDGLCCGVVVGGRQRTRSKPRSPPRPAGRPLFDTARQDKAALLQAIPTIDDDAWTTSKYTDAVFDEAPARSRSAGRSRSWPPTARCPEAAPRPRPGLGQRRQRALFSDLLDPRDRRTVDLMAVRHLAHRDLLAQQQLRAGLVLLQLRSICIANSDATTHRPACASGLLSATLGRASTEEGAIHSEGRAQLD